MPIKPILLLGAGGHAKVVLDALLSSGSSTENIILCDDNKALQGRPFLDLTIMPSSFIETQKSFCFHSAIGHNKAREEHYKTYSSQEYLTITHPKASISQFSSLGQGVFIACGAIIAPSVKINHGAIINHHAIIDHDCLIGAWSHIAPNATLGGNVTIGKNCLIGAGATLLPNLTIGDNVTIGAGSVVTKNIRSNNIVKGVPARL